MSVLQNLKSSLAAFGQDIGKSCYDVEWFRVIRAAPWLEGLKYMAALMALLAAIMTAAITPGVVSGLRGTREFIAKNIPDGASFAIKDGKFSTTLPTPTTLKIDQAAVVIDPSFSGLDFPSDIPKETAAFIGADAVFIYSSPTERQVRALKELPNFDVSKEQMVGKLNAYGPWAAVGLLLLLFVAYFGTVLAGNVIFVGVTSVMMMFAAKLWKVRMSVGQFAAVGFHAVTLPTLVDMTTAFFGLRIPYAFTGIYLLIMVAVVMDERNKPVEFVEGQSGEAAELRSGEAEGRGITRNDARPEVPAKAGNQLVSEEKAVVAAPEKHKKRAPHRAAKRKKSAGEKPPDENQGPPVVW